MLMAWQHKFEIENIQWRRIYSDMRYDQNQFLLKAFSRTTKALTNRYLSDWCNL